MTNLDNNLEGLLTIIQFALAERRASGKDLVTYLEDSEPGHEQGQSVGREEAYTAVIHKCAGIIYDATSKY